ncbi:hypothetical protein WBJ53_09140 [Spirosoma sp. SC4-14]
MKTATHNSLTPTLNKKRVHHLTKSAHQTTNPKRSTTITGTGTIATSF